MATAPLGPQLKCRVLLDPWTTAVASTAARRGDLKGLISTADEGSGNSVTASAVAAATTAEPKSQTPIPTNNSSVSTKFNLPQPNVLQLLRTAYYGAARNMHKRNAAQPAGASGNPSSILKGITETDDQGHCRKPKRLKAADGLSGDCASGTASRRGAAALKRLCAALGVYTQQEDLPEHDLSYAVASSRGWRVAMEDTYAAEIPLGGPSTSSPATAAAAAPAPPTAPSPPVSLFAVYDGHGGAEVARYSALRMGRAIRDATAAAATTASAPASGGANPPPTTTTDPSSTPWDSLPPQPHPPPAPQPLLLPPSLRASALRSAFLHLDRQLGQEAHLRELLALANPGVSTAPA
ncbi:hypothetical protein Agub_g8481, partial [Astrephomene gubernaculifera]